ncbi:MAG: hypothetical protein IK038_03280 [Bacteroidaceae bacterium]|nr:hypothetical protein [Bacteroidaceae bacterium]
MAKKAPERLTEITKDLKDELTPISWDAFRNTGLLAFVNGFLHIFGMTIAHDRNTGIAFPARTKWRGFNNEAWTKAYRKLSDYMVGTAKILKDEADED